MANRLNLFPSGAVGLVSWLGVASEPVLEARRADAWVIAGNEALIVLEPGSYLIKRIRVPKFLT